MVSWDHPQTGELYTLIINQAIYAPHLENHLLCPMQIRMNCVSINEIKSDKATNALKITDLSDDYTTLTITFRLLGVTTYFPYRKPTV